MKMITVENLSFLYRKSKRAVLHDFSLSLEKGRVYGLLGKNGAGKSTLLYLMSGLLTPKSGKVVYHDVDVRRRLPITLQDMFLVPEEFDLPPVSLISYIELNSPFYPRFSKEDMVKYLNYFEMDNNIDLGALSMGQKKKVFIVIEIIDTEELIVPHVEMHLRDFVLKPLAQIAPWKRHPVLLKTIKELEAELK